MQQAKINGVGKLNVRLKLRKSAKSITRFLKTNGIVYGDELCEELGIERAELRRLIKGIVRVVRAGYEVRLGEKDSAIRVYPLLNAECTKMMLMASTCGELRNESIGDLTFSVYNRDGEMTPGEVADRVEENEERYDERSRMISVTPDTVIECPKCKTRIRVGKALARKE